MFYFRYPVAGGSSDDFLPVQKHCCTENLHAVVVYLSFVIRADNNIRHPESATPAFAGGDHAAGDHPGGHCCGGAPGGPPLRTVHRPAVRGALHRQARHRQLLCILAAGMRESGAPASYWGGTPVWLPVFLAMMVSAKASPMSAQENPGGSRRGSGPRIWHWRPEDHPGP